MWPILLLVHFSGIETFDASSVPWPDLCACIAFAAGNSSLLWPIRITFHLSSVYLVYKEEDLSIHSKVHCEGAHSLWALSRRRLHPITLYTIGQHARSPGNSACSLLCRTYRFFISGGRKHRHFSVAYIHCSYPQRDSQAEWAWSVVGIYTDIVKILTGIVVA